MVGVGNLSHYSHPISDLPFWEENSENRLCGLEETGIRYSILTVLVMDGFCTQPNKMRPPSDLPIMCVNGEPRPSMIEKFDVGKVSTFYISSKYLLLLWLLILEDHGCHPGSVLLIITYFTGWSKPIYWDAPLCKLPEVNTIMTWMSRQNLLGCGEWVWMDSLLPPILYICICRFLSTLHGDLKRKFS